MELGEKLLQARLAAGLSQRQLCGGEITRNMLSQIEHGTAKPSMKTLWYLAERLGKPISFFLEEETLSAPNAKVMEKAWAAVDGKDFHEAVRALAEYQAPDPVFDREQRWLMALAHLALAEDALEQGRELYAAELLERVKTGDFPELQRRKWLLAAKLPGANLNEICGKLPDLDEELFLRARAAMENGQAERCVQLLDVMEDRTKGEWTLLRGRAELARGEFARAAEWFLAVEGAYPRETAGYLEVCYREMEDYKMAYYYACKGKA